MKIGLVRHYKVQLKAPFLISADNLNNWFKEYDLADVEMLAVDLGKVEWKRCISSDLPRAMKTAMAIYKGNIITKKELREISPPIFKGKILLPFFVWGILIRLSRLMNHKSQQESKTDIDHRMKQLLDEVLTESEDDVLMVCHGWLMLELKKELNRRGFYGGAGLWRLKNGELYLFERT